MKRQASFQRVTDVQLAGIVAAAMDAIISTDADQRITLFNGAAEAMFQYPAAEVLGQPLDVLIPLRFRAAHRAHVDGFGRGGTTSRSMQSPGELVGLRADGEEFPIEAMITHAETPDGLIYAVIIRDITERVRTEAARQEFLAMLAHELRNPLGAISNALYVVRQHVEDPELERPLSILDRQVAQMSRLVSDLIDVSRMTRGVLSLHREETELIGVIQSAVEPLTHRFEERRLQLEIDLPSDPIHLSADTVRLHQVLGNLLDNAVKYNDPGGTVRIEARREGDTAVVSVRDYGPGIAADLMPRLFEPFVQGKQGPDRGHGGLGLGLTLCYRIVVLHGGTFEAVSAGSGTGAEFIIRLPIQG